MSYPFGDHPKFGQYIEWATSQGCEIKQGVRYADGAAYSITKITAPSGQYYIDVGTQHNDPLLPTTISRLDRRLGLQSPFVSLPDAEDAPNS